MMMTSYSKFVCWLVCLFVGWFICWLVCWFVCLLVMYSCVLRKSELRLRVEEGEFTGCTSIRIVESRIRE